MNEENIIIEHGIDHKNDKTIYRERKRITNIANKQIEVTVIKSRDRLIHTDIANNKPGHITYSDWKIVKTQRKETLIK